VGRLVAQGPLAELRAGTTPRVRVETGRAADAAVTLRRLGLSGVIVEPGAATALLGSAEPERVVAALVYDGVPVRGFGVLAPDLEDVFVALTGEGFDVSA